MGNFSNKGSVLFLEINFKAHFLQVLCKFPMYSAWVVFPFVESIFIFVETFDLNIDCLLAMSDCSIILEMSFIGILANKVTVPNQSLLVNEVWMTQANPISSHSFLLSIKTSSVKLFFDRMHSVPCRKTFCRASEHILSWDRMGTRVGDAFRLLT